MADHESALNNEISGYASEVSISAGKKITFYVSVNTPQLFDIDIYRMGWYYGSGGRLIYTKTGLQGRTQVLSEADHTTGLIDYNWVLDGPIDDYSWTPTQDITSGFFIAKLTAQQSGKQSYIGFVVRDDNRVSDFLFQAAVTTYQAYNFYPYDLGNTDWRSGKSLYNGLSFVRRFPKEILIRIQI